MLLCETEASENQIEETKRAKDQVIAEKDAQIAELKGKMEEMAHEFGDMLKETLDKMKKSIGSSFESDARPIVGRMEEFSISPQAQ